MTSPLRTQAAFRALQGPVHRRRPRRDQMEPTPLELHRQEILRVTIQLKEQEVGSPSWNLLQAEKVELLRKENKMMDLEADERLERLKQASLEEERRMEDAAAKEKEGAKAPQPGAPELQSWDGIKGAFRADLEDLAALFSTWGLIQGGGLKRGLQRFLTGPLVLFLCVTVQVLLLSYQETIQQSIGLQGPWVGDALRVVVRILEYTIPALLFLALHTDARRCARILLAAVRQLGLSGLLRYAAMLILSTISLPQYTVQKFKKPGTAALHLWWTMYFWLLVAVVSIAIPDVNGQIKQAADDGREDTWLVITQSTTLLFVALKALIKHLMDLDDKYGVVLLSPASMQESARCGITTLSTIFFACVYVVWPEGGFWFVTGAVPIDVPESPNNHTALHVGRSQGGADQQQGPGSSVAGGVAAGGVAAGGVAVGSNIGEQPGASQRVARRKGRSSGGGAASAADPERQHLMGQGQKGGSSQVS